MKTVKIVIALGVVAAIGVAVLPLTSYAAETATTNVTVNIQSTLSVTATPAVNATITNNAAVNSTMAPIVTAITNNASGYVLKAKTSHANGPALQGSVSGTIAAGVPAQGESKWALSGGDLSGYTALSTTDTTVKTVTSPTSASGEATTFHIGVTAASDLPAGNYTGTITWTISARS